MQSDKVYVHNNEGDVIWWLEAPMPKDGEWIFSFDKQTDYNMFRDYPWALSREEKEIFDRENPFWADFFKDRQ